MGGPNSGAKDRKPGEWQAVERSRRHKDRFVTHSRGLSGIPIMGVVGSAAYRRLIAKKAAKHGS